MTTVAMKAPNGFTGSVSGGTATPPSSGTTYTPDANGFLAAVDTRDVLSLMSLGFSVSPPTAKVATADNGTTQTLTGAMLAGAALVFHTSTGGTTPSLTLPLAADFLLANPQLNIGDSMVLRVINANSGTATIVTNTGWTTTGTLTLATNTWREFVVTRTALATCTIVAAGTGTTS